MAVIALLECGHYVQYPSIHAPWSGTPCEHCPDCKTMCNVRVEWPESWWSGCQDCPGTKSHGNAHVYAENAARRHTAATGHRSWVRWYGKAPSVARASVARRAAKKRADNPDQNGPPPF